MAPTPKQRRAAKQRDAHAWKRNEHKQSRVYESGVHVKHTGSGKLGTITEVFVDQDCLKRAKVRNFNGEQWDWNPPLALLEIV